MGVFVHPSAYQEIFQYVKLKLLSAGQKSKNL